MRTAPRSGDLFQTITRNDYDGDADLDTGEGTTYALGAIVWQHQEKWKVSYTCNNSNMDDTMTRFDSVWWDGAVQLAVVYDKNYNFSSHYNYSYFVVLHLYGILGGKSRPTSEICRTPHIS